MLEKFKNKIICGDTLEKLKKLPSDCIDTIITSPPYWGLRDYGVEGQIGLEKTLEEYIDKLLAIISECKRVLKPTGVMFWNHGDCYSSQHTGGFHSEKSLIKGKGIANAQSFRQPDGKRILPAKCLMLQNYRLILKMIDQQGWILRNTIIWHKPNHMPSSVKDRFANSYESVYMLVKNNNPIYYYNTKTGLMADKKPKELKEGIDWDWKERDIYEPDKTKKQDMAGNPTYVGFNARWQGKTEKKLKKVSYWKSVSYWFDLDAVRVEHTSTRWGGINDSRCKEGDYALPNYKQGIRSHKNDYSPKGKNPGDVWKIATQPFPEAHFATFPEKLIEPMILSNCPKEICKKCGKARVRITKVKSNYISREKAHQPNNTITKIDSTGWKPPTIELLGWIDCKCKAGFEAGIVLDPFSGAGTVAVVAKRLGRNYIGIDINEEYCDMSRQRIRKQPTPLL